jgi:hypothetical protein
MKPLCVLSVPHTGTFFTYYLLPGKHAKLEIEEDHKYFAHVTDPSHTRFFDKCRIIVPLRQYAEVEASWIRRKLDLTELANAWSYMLTLKDVFWFPIDTPDREVRLKDLSKELGVDLKTNWFTVHSILGAKAI